MIIGVPKEIKSDEKRVALVPSGVAAFVQHGHQVLVEKGAGIGSGLPDGAYREAGAQIVSAAAKVWEQANLIIKVKEPLGPELDQMRAGQIIYTYLHLASNRDLTEKLLAKKVTGIGYETIQTEDGSLPLLIPMSEVAGRLSLQKGAQCLESISGGLGILLSGVSGVKPANVVILGAGTAGANACHVAVGMGARVSILDINPARLRYISDVMRGQVTTIMANTAQYQRGSRAGRLGDWLRTRARRPCAKAHKQGADQADATWLRHRGCGDRPGRVHRDGQGDHPPRPDLYRE